ncbi:11360_t:CDS:1, partial [Dentiscutata heterogama]
QETESSLEITSDVISSKEFGKDIVKIPFFCEVDIDKAYQEAWNEIIKDDKSKPKYKIQDYSSKAFAPWNII